jgi:hypothetical protein
MIIKATAPLSQAAANMWVISRGFQPAPFVREIAFFGAVRSSAGHRLVHFAATSRNGQELTGFTCTHLNQFAARRESGAPTS